MFPPDQRYRAQSQPRTPTGLGSGSMPPVNPPSQMMPPSVLDETSPAETATHQAVRDGPNAPKTAPHRRESIKGSFRGSMRARLRRQTNGESSRRNWDGSSSKESSRPSTGQRPSSSWLQRISTVSSPRNGSSRSSSCPDSPSMSGSTAQMLPSSPMASDLAPNKLVKRSTSQRAISTGNPTRPLGRSPTTPGLRRPATSHQRASTPFYRDERRHEFPDSKNYISNIETPETTNALPDDTWHPYFTSGRRATAHKYHRKRADSSGAKGESVQQLTVEPGNLPTLLLATSITSGTRDTAPTDPVPSNRQTSDRPDNAPPFKSTSRENENQEFSRPRNRALTNHPTAWNGLGEAQRKNRGNSVSYGKARNISQLEDLKTSKTERITSQSLGLRRRRNITDPSVFQRPMTSSQDGFYSAQVNSNGKGNPPAGFRLPPLPRPLELNIDVSGESASWQPAPIPDPRATSQRQRHTSQGSNLSSGVSCPRPKRFSTAASDPASTLIGSDNDTKVFTSGDEDETDFQSDTAYDSFPNRGMRSSDSVSRPRIESIFDQPTSSLTRGKLAALERSIPIGAPNTSGYDNIYGVTSSSSEVATRPLNAYDIPGDDYKLPYNTSSKEQPQQPILPEAFVSGPGHDVGPMKYSGKELKQCLFDWSEQHKGERDTQGSAFRPSTVHGKNEDEARATRALTRRGPSVLHLRSQSVPVSRDPNFPTESHNPSVKFGTWGLGNKGVSEDWDGDFEFEEPEEQINSGYGGDTTNSTPASQGMKVPQAIMERQASVHGQFGHVKELTLLVEELRRLRLQAKALCITDGPSNELWKEAEGIINLATVDDNEGTPNPPRSPSSPTISLDWCDDESPRSKKGRGHCIHDPDPNCSPLSIRTNYSPSTTILPDSPRNASSTKAQSVLDTIYQQRKVHDTVQPEAMAHSQHRLPFDTQSLRDLVVRAGVVTRALKDIVRKAQGVSSDMDNDLMRQDPPFSQIFNRPSNDPSLFQTPDLPNGKGGNGYHNDVSLPVANENEISAHMKMMTVV